MEPKKNSKPINEMHSAFILELLLSISATFTVRIPAETQTIYTQLLAPFPPAALQEGVDCVIRQWDKPCMFPPPSFILERVSEAARMNVRAVLDRGDKPPNWEPLTAEEHADLFQKFRETLHREDERNRMPDTGKEKSAEQRWEESRARQLKALAELLQRQAGEALPS